MLGLKDWYICGLGWLNWHVQSEAIVCTFGQRGSSRWKLTLFAVTKRFTSLGHSGKWRGKVVWEVASQSDTPIYLPFTPPPLCPLVQMWSLTILSYDRLRFHGVMVSTLVFESSNPTSNPGGTYRQRPWLQMLNPKCFMVSLAIFPSSYKCPGGLS